MGNSSLSSPSLHTQMSKRYFTFQGAKGDKAITMNSLAVITGVAATTITRLARNDDKAASALSLDLASKLVTALDCGIEDLLEVVEG